MNWVPRKIEVPVILPAGPLQLDKFLGRGMQPDEHALPDADESALSSRLISASD